jgi:hypothetical protein
MHKPPFLQGFLPKSQGATSHRTPVKLAVGLQSHVKVKVSDVSQIPSFWQGFGRHWCSSHVSPKKLSVDSQAQAVASIPVMLETEQIPSF